MRNPMRKVFLSTTALVAVAMVAPAQAQESAMMSAAGNDLNIGGYFEMGFVSGDFNNTSDQDRAGKQQTYGDSELYIDFEGTTDGGMVYGVQIDLEIAAGSAAGARRHRQGGGDVGNYIDEASIFLRGGFGTFIFGHDDPAGFYFHTWAPTHEGTFAQLDSIVAQAQPGGALASPASLFSFVNDDAKAVWISPNIGGITLAASYANGDGANATSGLGSNSYGASYTHEIGLPIVGNTAMTYNIGTVRGNTRFVPATNPDGTPSTAPNAGAKINNSGVNETVYGVRAVVRDFTLTIGYGEQVRGVQGNAENQAKEVTELGIGWRMNEKISVGMTVATAKGADIGENPTNRGVYDTFDRNAESTFNSASISYALAPGLKTTLAYNNADVGTDRNAGRVKQAETVWQVEFSF